MGKLYNYFDTINKENKFGHAFLIGNTVFLSCKNELEEVFSKILFKEKVTIDNNPDIYVLEPDGNNINKAQVKDLLEKISTTSQVYGKKVYIITACESLSDNIYNILLKTIEEPGENIYAFLITSNIERVVKTIRSRCQEVFVSSGINSVMDEEAHKVALDMVEKIERNSFKAIGKNKELYSIIENRDFLKLVIGEIFNIYISVLYDKINYEKYDEDISCINDDTDVICKKVLAINSIIEKNSININKDLLIDKIILDIWRCNNETSIDRI